MAAVVAPLFDHIGAVVEPLRSSIAVAVPLDDCNVVQLLFTFLP